jgi:hypothetical protein
MFYPEIEPGPPQVGVEHFEQLINSYSEHLRTGMRTSTGNVSTENAPDTLIIKSFEASGAHRYLVLGFVLLS